MLANGITLAVKKKGASDYVELQDLKEVPELGVDAEKVENTRLKDNFKHSELGIGDPGDMRISSCTTTPARVRITGFCGRSQTVKKWHHTARHFRTVQCMNSTHTAASRWAAVA